ncbi:hypothetical protein mRhiFer1_008275 [Rhinolophus ferrumequinum]|uniref:Uncharacterized protein n=1 Tax=Rhinolophus ferrumequinum TaxID=59479 RepID=A0A7J7VRF2_RHIFE|nr:hypothetical protein mRhiFer1_008275 [Rhinolophus ferrumequinum]
MQQDKVWENKSDPVSTPLSRAEELNAAQSKTTEILTTCKPGISQRIPVNGNKGEITVSTGSAPAKIPVLQDPKSSDSREQLSGELQSELENRERSQAQGQRSDMSFVSNGLIHRGSLTHAQGVSSVDLGATQVLHLHLEARGVSMQQRQEPRLPEHVLRTFILGECKKQENSQEKGSSVSSTQSRGPERSRRAFTGATQGPKVMTGMGKFLQERLGCRHATDMPCPQEPRPSPVKSGQAQQKAQVPAQAGPIQGHPFNSWAPCCKVTKSCQQTAGFAGQSSTSLRQIRDKDTQTQNVAAFKEQL